jgi:poly(3-hydroxybutyrate) depolymerase
LQITNTQNILTAVQGTLNIDPTRIYAVGFSNGAGFVNLLACTPSTADVFAAYSMNSAAIYAGTKAYSGCDPGQNQISIINFHVRYLNVD